MVVMMWWWWWCWWWWWWSYWWCWCWWWWWWWWCDDDGDSEDDDDDDNDDDGVDVSAVPQCWGGVGSARCRNTSEISWCLVGGALVPGRTVRNTVSSSSKGPNPKCTPPSTLSRSGFTRVNRWGVCFLLCSSHLEQSFREFSEILWHISFDTITVSFHSLIWLCSRDIKDFFMCWSVLWSDDFVFYLSSSSSHCSHLTIVCFLL